MKPWKRWFRKPKEEFTVEVVWLGPDLNELKEFPTCEELGVGPCSYKGVLTRDGIKQQCAVCDAESPEVKVRDTTTSETRRLLRKFK